MAIHAPARASPTPRSVLTGTAPVSTAPPPSQSPPPTKAALAGCPPGFHGAAAKARSRRSALARAALCSEAASPSRAAAGGVQSKTVVAAGFLETGSVQTNTRRCSRPCGHGIRALAACTAHPHATHAVSASARSDGGCTRGRRPRRHAGVDVAAVSAVPVQWQGRAQSRCRGGHGLSPVPSPMWAGVGLVPVLMSHGRAHSR